ncbi:MAG TPA: extracellular solute-binding protein [Clostridiales bacterium]|nr:extracellular solute-binding protein [Clostridiales bacterium]
MKKRILSIALACAMIVASFAGCGGGTTTSTDAGSAAGSDASQAATETKKIRVAWWGNQVRNDRTTKVLKMYEEKNPGVKFETEFSDWSGYWDKMATEAAANSMPDIIQMDYQYIKQYVNKKQLADLTPYVGKQLKLDDVSQFSVDVGKFNDKLYGVSLGVTSPAMIYDIDSVQQAGVTLKNGMTMSEFIDAAKKIKEKTGKTCDFVYSDGETMMEYLVRGQGKVLFQDGKLGIDSSKDVLPFFQLFEDGVKGGYLTSAEDLDASVGTGIEQGLLVLGKQWEVMTTSNQLSAYAAAAKDKKLGIVTWPVGDNDTQKAMFLKPSMYFSVSAASKNVEECAKVIDFFTNNAEAYETLLTDRGVPVSNKVQEAIKPKVDESSKQLFDYISAIESECSDTNPPPPAGMTEVATLAHNLTEQVVYQKLTAQQAADQFFTQANAILKKAAG